MTRITDTANRGRALINHYYTAEQQEIAMNTYKQSLLTTISDCKDYISTTSTPIDLVYSLDSMEATLNRQEPIDLYNFIEIARDVTSAYQIPYTCQGTFDSIHNDFSIHKLDMLHLHEFGFHYDTGETISSDQSDL